MNKEVVVLYERIIWLISYCSDLNSNKDTEVYNSSFFGSVSGVKKVLLHIIGSIGWS
jgi:hypothetical protein